MLAVRFQYLTSWPAQLKASEPAKDPIADPEWSSADIAIDFNTC